MNAAFLNRQSLLIALLFAAFIIFSLWQGEETPPRPYDLDSAGPTGLRGLRLWLAEMGYPVARTGQRAFTLADDGASTAAMLFVYPNAQPYTAEEAMDLLVWVQAGGTLVLVGPTATDTELGTTFDVYQAEAFDLYSREAQSQPLLPDVDASRLHIGSTALDTTRAANAVPVLALSRGGQQGAVTMAVQQVDDGTVWHLSSYHDLVNEKLRDQQEAALVPALLRTVPAGGTILFDTYHLLGATNRNPEQAITSVQDWLYRTYVGWAVLFTLATSLLYLLLQGRRLGPALPTLAATRRREAAEYVYAMASLQRRARQRDAVARHHKQRFKRLLGKPLHIRPDLPDPEFMIRLRDGESRLSAETLDQVSDLLNKLDHNPNETSLVQIVAAIDNIVGRRE